MATDQYTEESRYSRAALLASEFLYGDGFQSPGGAAAVAGFAAGIELPPGARVLDVGSGTGGASRHLARALGAGLVGVDASIDCVRLADERKRADGDRSVAYLQMDARRLAFADGSFALVWSRDSLACIDDKASVLRDAHRVLVPGGRLLMTDFCRADRPSATFDRYAEDCGWHVVPLAEYRRQLDAVGFAGVSVDDISDDMATWLRTEFARLERGRDEFERRFGAPAYDRMARRWRQKQEFCDRGDLVWARFGGRRSEA
jgi:phosphoethanolamine N-methyltransferase